VSTEITLLGFGIAKDTFINLAGLFGGFFPFIVDLIQRQNIEISKRTDLCKLFYFVVSDHFRPSFPCGATP